MEKGNCAYCNKSLRSFNKTSDWNSRQYHKKCYLKLKDIELSIRLYVK